MVLGRDFIVDYVPSSNWLPLRLFVCLDKKKAFRVLLPCSNRYRCSQPSTNGSSFSPKKIMVLLQKKEAATGAIGKVITNKLKPLTPFSSEMTNIAFLWGSLSQKTSFTCSSPKLLLQSQSPNPHHQLDF